MKPVKFPLALAFGVLVLSAAAAQSAPSSNRALFDLWGKVSRPLPGDPAPIGTYGAGCLGGARPLPLDGVGYSVMRPSRLRYFGMPDLVSFIEELGRKMKEEKLPLLLVGDMGRPRGGPMPTGHSSHQIGLDVDLWYRMSKTRPSAEQRETWSAESFVKGDRELSRAWNDSYRKLLATAAQSPYVNRIFVHPAIKRDLCEHFKDAPWLYKFRAWWAHHDHLHVRLNCPSGSPACQPQPPLDPNNNQCGKDLNWWFTAEARDEGSKKSAAFAERAFPELPAACGKMVKDLESEKK